MIINKAPQWEIGYINKGNIWTLKTNQPMASKLADIARGKEFEKYLTQEFHVSLKELLTLETEKLFTFLQFIWPMGYIHSQTYMKPLHHSVKTHPHLQSNNTNTRSNSPSILGWTTYPIHLRCRASTSAIDPKSSSGVAYRRSTQLDAWTTDTHTSVT